MSYGYSIETVANLKAISQTFLNDVVSTRGVPSLIVEEKNTWYTYNPTSTAVGDDDLVITPTSGVGRWLAHSSSLALENNSTPILGVKKLNIVNGNITTLNDTATLTLPSQFTLGILDDSTFIGDATELNFTGSANVTFLNGRANINVVGGGNASQNLSWDELWIDLDAWSELYLGINGSSFFDWIQVINDYDKWSIAFLGI